MNTDPENVEEHILKKYELLKKLGSGAYGHVWKVREIRTGKVFALKKIFDAFQHATDSQRTYREIAVLRQLNHPNIVALHEVIKPEKCLKDIYLVFEYMESDVHNVVCENLLQEVHKRYIVYQIIKGLKYLHSAQLVHRDLKPSNILLNSDCLTKICDFGLVRSVAKDEDDNPVLTEGVATRWYRAPEVLLGSKDYDQKADMWSVGCIIAEILLQKPLFPGTSTLNQLERILSFTGRPSAADVASLKSDLAKTMIDELKNPLKIKDPREMFSTQADLNAFDLIQKLLLFNPNKRLTATEALNHPYLSDFSNKKEEIQYKGRIKLDVNDNVKLSVQDYRRMIFAMAQKEPGSTSPSEQNSRIANRFESPKKFSDLKKVSAARKDSKNSSICNNETVTPAKYKSPVNNNLEKTLNSTLQHTFIQKQAVVNSTISQQQANKMNTVKSQTGLVKAKHQGSPNSFKEIIQRQLREKENYNCNTGNKENRQLNGTAKLGELLGQHEVKESRLNTFGLSPKYVDAKSLNGPTFSGLSQHAR